MSIESGGLRRGWRRPLSLGALALAAASAAARSPRAARPGSAEVDPLLGDAYFRHTDAIVEGACIGRRSFWDSDSRLIFTEYRFRADRVFLGEVAPVVRVVQPGGVLPERHLGLTVSGSPTYAPDERAILFLWRSPRGTFRVNVNGPVVGSLRVRRHGAHARAFAGRHPYERAVASIEARVRAMQTAGRPGRSP